MLSGAMFVAIAELCLQFLQKEMFAKQKNENFINLMSKHNLTLCVGMEMSKEKLQQTLLVYSKQLQEHKERMLCTKK
jgi:hypothetical protein